MPLRAALAASRLFTARRRAAHVAISVARRRGVFVSGLLQISSWGGSLPPGGSSAVLTSIRFNGLFARWETSFLQNCPLQIRLVLSTTGPFRVRTRGLGAISDRLLRMLPRHSWGRGLVAGVLARVVHGRRVGEGTAFVQWGGVRVEGASGGGAPFECPQDRLRQAQGERRGFEARLRCGLVGACRRPAHLWIPAFAGTTIAGVGSRRSGDAPAPGPCPGFPLSRERRLGVCGTRGGWWWRRAPFECPQDRLRQAQGERNHASPRPRGFGHSIGVGAGISRDRRLGVCGTRGGLWWRRAPFDRLRANGIAHRPYGFRGVDARYGERIGLHDGADAAVHVYGGAGYEAGSL